MTSQLQNHSQSREVRSAHTHPGVNRDGDIIQGSVSQLPGTDLRALDKEAIEHHSQGSDALMSSDAQILDSHFLKLNSLVALARGGTWWPALFPMLKEIPGGMGKQRWASFEGQSALWETAAASLLKHCIWAPEGRTNHSFLDSASRLLISPLPGTWSSF